MNDQSAIPHGERIPARETDLSLPELPDPWGWRAANHNGYGKVNLYFGRNVYEPGGWLGEIDNYDHGDGGVKWDVHVREILAVDEDDVLDKDTRPCEEAETVETFDTLAEAIEHVPEHIETYYE